MKRRLSHAFLLLLVIVAALHVLLAQTTTPYTKTSRMVEQGKATFRFDTVGDQAFWCDTLKLHEAIEGAKLGGLGPGVSPATALAVGLKVDQDALPASLVRALKAGQVNLNDPAVTLALLKLNAVVGVTGVL